jgi:rhodanese-related sulfurtransferase
MMVEKCMSRSVSAQQARTLILSGAEAALLDVREPGQFGEGHALLATPVAYSRLEMNVERLVPRKSVPVLLMDDGDGVAQRAANRLDVLGYTDVAVVDGGMPAWGQAGFTVYKGVNVPSKTFGELVEHERDTPSISAQELQGMRESGKKLVILDGRTPEEFLRMSIPDAVSCPNAELGLRLHALAPDGDTTVVVNCAGRTRSIMGAQGLIDLGVDNDVVALRNGTKGWLLADYRLDSDSRRTYPRELTDEGRNKAREQAAKLAQRSKVQTIDVAALDVWRQDVQRTLYILDVRTAEEFEAGHVPGAVHAPGGQLVQATDEWLSVRGARVVLVDDEVSRAVVAAHWLRGMGHEAYVLEACGDATERAGSHGSYAPPLEALDASKVRREMDAGAVCIDLRSSAAHRAQHPMGAVWSIRPRLNELGSIGRAVLLADSREVADLAATDLTSTGTHVAGFVTDSVELWEEAALSVVATPDSPADSARIDYLFFVHDRDTGNLDAAREYLDWETGLIGQLDTQEQALFSVA